MATHKQSSTKTLNELLKRVRGYINIQEVVVKKFPIRFKLAYMNVELK
jgi:hypothetical protein